MFAVSGYSFMFAVVKIGGRQYKVSPGDKIHVDYQNALPGDRLALRDVLTVGNDDGSVLVGAPTVEGAAISVTVLDTARTRKIIVFKKRRRKNSRRKNGHRSIYNVLQVEAIVTDGSAIEEHRADPFAVWTEFKPLEAAQGRPDPLSMIPGVGKDGQRALNASGVFHFRQFAALDDSKLPAEMVPAVLWTRNFLQAIRNEEQGDTQHGE